MAEKNLVVGYGRFTIPTTGHMKVYDKVLELAKRENATPVIWTTKTYDGNRKNPLKPDEKIKFLKSAFPRLKVVAIDGSIIEQLKRESPVEKLTLVVGNDRGSEFTTLLNKYNHKEFDIGTIEVIDVGSRDNSISASDLRMWGKEGEKEKFYKNLSPNLSQKEKEELFRLVNERMNSEGKPKEKKEKKSLTEQVESMIYINQIKNLIRSDPERFKILNQTVIQDTSIKFDPFKKIYTFSLQGYTNKLKFVSSDVTFETDMQVVQPVNDNTIKSFCEEICYLVALLNDESDYTSEQIRMGIHDGTSDRFTSIDTGYRLTLSNKKKFFVSIDYDEFRNFERQKNEPLEEVVRLRIETFDIDVLDKKSTILG